MKPARPVVFVSKKCLGGVQKSGGGSAVMLKLSAMCGEEEGVSEVFLKVKGGRQSA